MFRLMKSVLIIFVITSVNATAQEVRITPDLDTFSVTINGEVIEIGRIQDTSNRLVSEFAKTSRPCPPFCVHALSAAPGVQTLGELEILDYIEAQVADGRGLLIDARVPEWFSKGTIPGAINIPFPTLAETNPFRNEILKALGAVQDGDDWNFDAAMELSLFGNGPWSDQSPRAIQALISAGYPVEKLHYYRGGIQMWMLFGLTLHDPNA